MSPWQLVYEILFGLEKVTGEVSQEVSQPFLMLETSHLSCI